MVSEKLYGSQMEEATQFINSPVVREATRFINSSVVKEATRFINSSVVKEATRFINSPAVQEATRFINSPAVQEATRFINSSVVKEATRFINSPAIQEATRFMNSQAVKAAQTAAWIAEDALRTAKLAGVDFAAIHRAVDFTGELSSQDVSAFENMSCAVGKSDLLMESFLSVVDEAEPYIQSTSEDRIEVTAPDPVPKSKHTLSLSDFLAIISILLTLYTTIVTTHPSEQLERIIEQNSTIIELQEEIIEQNKEDIGLKRTLDRLSDCIDLFIEESKSLHDEGESVNNPTSLNAQAGACDSE